MHIQIKSSNGITLMPLETRLLASRKIFIEGEINAETACEFVKQVLLLNQEDPKKPIDVLINSMGGEINSGMLVYDVIQSSKAPVRMFCVGKAYSMAALLFASGAKGQRYMLPHSELMLHEPLLGNRIGGNSSSIKSISDSLQETKRKMNQILAKHTGQSEKAVERATGFDHYFSPEESIAFGLCDEIIGFDKVMEA
ncbi:MAG: ATP-dependent Clp protease proteolytic subunit [Acidaminococcaceae bacterium]|nr:ATP-dependent Clp protease proteolytic subunit [Acidaminococcaceae bacterium]